MTTYQHAAPAPARSGGTDVAAWALVALIVAIVCAGAGWALARQATPGMDDLARDAELAARQGLLNGEADGYGEGAALGRRETSLRTRTQLAAERQRGAREGYDAGYGEGRAKAGDPNAFMSSGMGTGAYPSAGYEDVLASSLLDSDVPGFGNSAYDSMGYGTGSTSPYLGASSIGTSGGDSYSYGG